MSDSPSPPPAPDYTGAAKAQGAANVDTAITEGILNRPNQYTPYGSLTYNQTGSYTTPSGQVVPQFTSNVNLTPQGQAQFDQQQRINTALGGLAEQGIGRVGQTLGTPFDTASLPPAAQASDTARQAVVDALYGRMKPTLDANREQAESGLIAAGFNPSGEAYKAKQRDLSMAENDAMMNAQIAGGSEQSRLYGLESDARNQAIQQQAYLRSIPLNEINALRSGSQVSMPQFQGQGGTAVGQTPVFNAAQQQAQYNQGIYNQQAAGANASNAGLYNLVGSGLGAAAMFFSDIRLKSNIALVGMHPLGIGIYEYDIFDRRERGVMAHEVMTVKPNAVSQHKSGYLMVDYGSI